MSARTVDAVILGASGFGGGELMRLLPLHSRLRSLRAVSRKHVGKPIDSVHPHLRGIVTRNFEAEPNWNELAQSQHLVIFAAMPNGAFAGRWKDIEQALHTAGLAERAVVIDLSGDFRLGDAKTYTATYGKIHPYPEQLGQFVYGLTEWQRERLKDARRIANPGCFATAINLALLPLAPWIANGFVAIDGKTGSSGAGAELSAGTHHPTRAPDFRAYKMLAHQHEAELRLMLARCDIPGVEFSFVPHSTPLVRGIFVTLHLRTAAAVSYDACRALYENAYGGSKFIRLVDGSPRVAAVTGSNFCDIGFAVSGRIVTVMSTLDNLMKGMAGQAIQNMNIALGFEEASGLWQAAAYPG